MAVGSSQFPRPSNNSCEFIVSSSLALGEIQGAWKLFGPGFLGNSVGEIQQVLKMVLDDVHEDAEVQGLVLMNQDVPEARHALQPFR